MPFKPVRTINDFLLSTYFADGLRITFGVLTPPVLLAQLGHFEYGMAMALGALCVSVSDLPGPIVHRRNAMIISTLLITIFSLLTGLTNKQPLFVGSLLTISCFIFSMFLVFGVRASAVGTGVLLVMVLSIDDQRGSTDVMMQSGMLLIGGTWYSLLSYSVYRIRPFRMVQQALSDSIIEVSEFLRIKAKFYNEGVNYQETYDELLKHQVLVHEKQEAVREMLFKTREIVRDSTPEGRFLLLVFVDMVDLFEQVMSTYYNYKKLHEQFDSIGILKSYERVILHSCLALDDIAYSLKTGGSPKFNSSLKEEIKLLKQEILELEMNNADGKISTLGIIALKNIEINIENILSRIQTINSYFSETNKPYLKSRSIDINKFTTRQTINVKAFVSNLTLKSSIFRHALRVSIVMLIGFIIGRNIDSAHSYWILLTILVISKPGFSLTKKRNYERIIGTLAGSLIGIAIMYFIKDRNALFIILMICMIFSYSFQRKNYVVSVIFITPYSLLLFYFLGMGTLSVATERIYDTLIGCGIAFTSSYFLFPSWESENLKKGMLGVLNANKDYYEQVLRFYFEENPSLTAYKVSRKELYVQTANLASLFQRMLSEPKSKQVHIQELHQFTSLNHQLSSFIATLSLYYKDHAYKITDQQELKVLADNTLYLFSLAEKRINKKTDSIENVPLIRSNNEEVKELMEVSVSEQFILIQKVVYDIFKLTEKFKF